MSSPTFPKKPSLPQAAIGQLPMCLCSQLCRMQYLWPELLENTPLVALPSLSFQLMRLPCGRHPQPVRMYGSMSGGGGGKVCFEGEAMGPMVLHGWRG